MSKKASKEPAKKTTKTIVKEKPNSEPVQNEYDEKAVQKAQDELEHYWLSENQRADLSTVLNSPFGGEMIKPFSRTIFLRHMPVAGIFHVRNYRSLMKKIKVDDQLLLIREPQNEYDEWAILVMTQDREKLGYIPRRENRILARLMDAGKSIFAKISQIDPEPDKWDPLWIAIYMDD